MQRVKRDKSTQQQCNSAAQAEKKKVRHFLSSVVYKKIYGEYNVTSK